jgi:hypothetical protein
MLWLDASGLPYELALRVRLRSEYRYVSGGRSINPRLSFRTYDFYVQREMDDLRIKAGRFSNRYVPTGGYWDGIMVLNGDGDYDYGASIGFLPVRSNEQMSFDMPKAALFARFSRKSERLSNRIEAFFMEIRPTNELLPRHHLGVRHRLHRSGLSLFNRVDIDRDPHSGRWMFTRLSMRFLQALRWGLQIHGRYDVRQPYSIYRSVNVISYRRDQINAGLGYRGRRLTLSADMVWNFAYEAGDVRVLDGRSMTAAASLSRLAGMGFFTSGSYWWSELGSSTYGSVSVSRSFGRISSRLYYQVSASSRFDTNLTTHSVALQAAVPLSSRIRSTSKLRLQTGRYARSTSFETSVSVRL